MSKEIYISSTPHETRLAIVEKDELTEIYYERENEYTLAGSIYNGRVTRVLPGMQSSFVDIGLERDAFLYITDFMEEAADTADFDGAATGGEARAPRGDRPRAEGRGDGRSEARGEARNEGRGRGRRDGRDGERRNREPQPEFRTESTDEEFRSFAPADEEVLDETPRENNVEGTDDGIPGADGSRRWRGRRGRRRGRNAEQQAEAPAENVPDEIVVEAIPQQERAPRNEERTQRNEERAPRDSERRPSETRGDRASREGGSHEVGRERNGRERGDRGLERGGRDTRHDAVRERFAPRGAARPASSDDEVIDLNASAEPLILPGESLSKYRRDETRDQNGAASQPAPAKPAGVSLAAKPSTEIEPLVGWDGGLVLPGESLSRVRQTRPEARSESRDEGHREGRGEERGGERGGDRGRNRRHGRDEQRGRSGQASGREAGLEGSSNGRGHRDAAPAPEYRAEPRGIDPVEAVLPAVTSQHDVAEREYEPHYPASTDLAPVQTNESAVEHEAEFEEAVAELHEAEFAEFQETTSEYEPDENASASHRVDPVGQREFRQSAPVEEFAAEEVLEPEPVAAHAFTSLQPTGELISEVAHAEIAQADPTAPIEHETVVQSVHAGEAERTVPFETARESAQGVRQGFAPGHGQLEEELLDDEELEIDELHASVFDEDTEEEELLENAAGLPDLGSMIRDMTIDDITRHEPAGLDEEEDDDFEEDEEDFEEDELRSTDDLDSDLDSEEDEFSGSEVSEAEEEEFAVASSFEENDGAGTATAEGETAPREEGREGARDGGHRGRRDGRRNGRERGGSRARRGVVTSRPSGGGGRERGNRSMQSTNLPAISDLLKPGQEVLVQIAKEPIAKKGARITSHIALPGRFLVFMPTVNHAGVSRKIESDSERRRLKEILLNEKGDASGGFIVRTAAAGASEEELRSDLRFLLSLWSDIKTRSEGSKSPALIYHDLNLVERILRDQVTDNFSAIWVDTETEYERVLRFLQRFQPALIRRVKLYTKDTPLFEQFGITEEINKALRAKVWLKSGGSIVINQTEALVAIDINTGKYVGKTARLEDTILKTNLDAIPEIVRQIRLRDLGGIIIIDFIDMDERKNRNKVMGALEDELKKDRAPSKVLQFNDFGLVAITRKRVKQSLERTLSTTCGICAGTGMVKSPVTVCNDIYIEMRKMHKLIEKPDIMLRVNPEVVKQLKTGSGKWLQEMEEMSGKTILVKSDPSLHPEQFDIH